MNRSLTPKQEAFCQAMLVSDNASEAYRAAYSTKGGRSVNVNASRLLALPHVAARVQELRDRAADKAVAERHEALVELTMIARGRVGSFLRDDGSIDVAKLAKAGPELESFQLVDTEHGQRVTIKLRDPIRAIERLAKMLGWDAPDKLEVAGVTFNLNLGG